MDGLILIDKPKGPTSHDVVFRVRKLVAGEKTGHCGTLDPEATGLLLVTVGRATRLFPFLSAHDKAYEGTLRFGVATDTYDAAGQPVGPVCPDPPEEQQLLEAMARFEGPQSQFPPAFSAIKRNGRPLYEIARRGEEVVLEPRKVLIRRFALKNYAPPDAEFEAACSAGTYIRSLVHDLGQGLGCGAHLTGLRRTASGTFRLREALPLDRIESLAAAGRLDEALLPMESLLTEFPGVTVGPEGAERAAHGNLILPCHATGPDPAGVFSGSEGSIVRLLAPEGRLLALARPSIDGPGLSPYLVLAEPSPR